MLSMVKLLCVNVYTINYRNFKQNTTGTAGNENKYVSEAIAVVSITLLLSCLLAFALTRFCEHLDAEHYYYPKGYEPSKKVRISAIVYVITQFTLYFTFFCVFSTGWILCETNSIMSVNITYLRIQHPYFGWFCSISFCIISICFIYSTFGGFALSVLFKLQDLVKQETVVKSALPRIKFMNYIVYFAISVQFTGGVSLTAILSLKNVHIWGNESLFVKDWCTMIGVLLWGIIDLFVHGLLLSLYLKGLFRWTQYCQQKDVKDQVHERTIQITTYSVLFGIYMIIIVIMNIIFVSLQIVWNLEQYVWNNTEATEFSTINNISTLLLFGIRDIVSSLILFLSFDFSYRWYKDYLCGKCDKRMRTYCEKKVQRHNQDRGPLLSVQEYHGWK